ncbi:flavin-nucleotide-binding protein [Cenarchaeum symbiosum A]|uniref:Flavin-nucleotide-binding protein n=1 Tax=Cenarchaeum symbiosum (strain A) TaxID=414004 RepID=A0RUB9_CENSY|nr:flavin-nucleotide-binding protein [Cenarchaeum symbiosum A]
MAGAAENIGQLKYISLETFKKSGEGVKTPVWFVATEGVIYVATGRSTGKAKRIANNPRVRFAPCTFRGGIKGDWTEGSAEQLSGEEEISIMGLRKKKYGVMSLLSGLAGRSKGGMTVYRIKED